MGLDFDAAVCVAVDLVVAGADDDGALHALNARARGLARGAEDDIVGNAGDVAFVLRLGCTGWLFGQDLRLGAFVFDGD